MTSLGDSLPFETTVTSEASTDDMFREALLLKGIDSIASRFGLNPNTVRRWWQEGQVPEEYRHDLSRLLEVELSPDQNCGIDQFYTLSETAEYCWEVFAKTASAHDIDLDSYTFIEPSAGSGSFYNLMPPDRRIGVDIAPSSCPDVLLADFLRWTPAENKPYVVVGNPPFGLRGHLALQFINHASSFADLIGFVLPQMFESDGKGVPAKRVDQMSLIYSEKLPADSFFLPDGSPSAIHTVFQVWAGEHLEIPSILSETTCREWIKVYSLSDGGAPSSTRNKNMIGQCDVYLPSTCFKGMQAYLSFEELPNRRGYGVCILQEQDIIRKVLVEHDWHRTAYRSTNGALNLRTSLIEQVVVAAGFSDPIVSYGS